MHVAKITELVILIWSFQGNLNGRLSLVWSQRQDLTSATLPLVSVTQGESGTGPFRVFETLKTGNSGGAKGKFWGVLNTRGYGPVFCSG
jgi:hypothetical protein